MGLPKGRTNNPNGRPKDGQSWAGMLSKLCEEKVTVGGTEMEKKEAICRRLLLLASQGERWAIEALMDRIDGKPKTVAEVDHTTNGKDLNTIERVVVKAPDTNA